MKCNSISPAAVGLVSVEQRGQDRYWKQNMPDTHPIRCLVVDDDQTILKYVAQMLAILEFEEAETAQTHPEVMNKIIAGPHELLITDLEMPDMYGYVLSQNMKKDAHDDIKTIIMTGRPKDDCLEMMATRWGGRVAVQAFWIDGNALDAIVFGGDLGRTLSKLGRPTFPKKCQLHWKPPL
jgi:CheY-like chemotaxis protein